MKWIVAVAQICSGAEVFANLTKVEKLTKEASKNGASLIVFPENFALMPKVPDQIHSIAENFGHGEIQDFIKKLAQHYQIGIVAGSMPLKNDTNNSQNKYYSSSLVYNNKGDIIARYDKIHLFDVITPNAKEQYLESKQYLAGDRISLFETPIGKAGLSICYDLRFPELFREMSSQQAKIFIIPAAFTYETGKAHWDILLKARAIENLCYVLSAAQTGVHPNGRTTYGHSQIISPWGETLAECPEGEGIAIAELDSEKQNHLQQLFPVLQQRKRG